MRSKKVKQLKKLLDKDDPSFLIKENNQIKYDKRIFRNAKKIYSGRKGSEARNWLRNKLRQGIDITQRDYTDEVIEAKNTDITDTTEQTKHITRV